MPRLTPLPRMDGQSAYLIGGGRSLRGFNFDQLRDKPVIGCNQAFLLGPEICPLTIFGDFKFWCSYAKELGKYDGWVVTPRHTTTKQADWIHFYERQSEGLSETKLAWNASTGAAAINLALILGAAKIYLLGYDCGMNVLRAAYPDGSHWHDGRIEQPTPEHYRRFAYGFENIARALPVIFPGREVYNVSNGVSRLVAFPTVCFESVGLEAPPDERLQPNARERPGCNPLADLGGRSDGRRPEYFSQLEEDPSVGINPIYRQGVEAR